MWPVALSMMLLATAPVSPAAAAPPDTTAGRYANEEALRHYMNGRWQELGGSTEDALGEYNRTLSLDPTAASVLVRLSEAAAGAGQASASLDFAQRALALRPHDARALWLAGAALFNLERPAEALPKLEAACREDSTQAEYLRTLARVAEMQGRVDLVERSYARAVEVDDEDAESWFQLAAAEARQARFAAADSALDRSLALNPIRPGAFFLRGWIRESLGRTDDAIEQYQKHLGVHTTDQSTRHRLILLLAQRERFAEAYEQARIVATAQPEDPDALQMEADLAYQLGHADVGSRALVKLRALDASDPDLVARSVMVLSRHDHARDGVRVADAWAAAHADDPRGLLLSARSRAVAGQFDSAAVYARRAIAAEPDSLDPERLLVRVLMDGHHFDAATKELETQHERRPGDVAVLLDLGQCREEAGDIGGAVRAGRDALQLAPEAAPVQNFLGYLLADHRVDLPEAEKLLDRAIAQEPDNGAYVDSYGWLLYQVGRLSEARQQLERALVLTGGDPVIHEHLGDVYRGLKLPELARQQYKLSLAHDSGNSRVRGKLEALR